jgi:hypothetical protein
MADVKGLVKEGENKGFIKHSNVVKARQVLSISYLPCNRPAMVGKR